MFYVHVSVVNAHLSFNNNYNSRPFKTTLTPHGDHLHNFQIRFCNPRAEKRSFDRNTRGAFYTHTYTLTHTHTHALYT